MALIIADRVRETTATTGTGTYTLAGAVTGYQSFSSVCSDSDTVYYVVTDNSDFEVGLGTFTSSGTTLARTTIYESSNSDAAVSWGSGDKQVFITVPASRFMYLDASGDLNMADNAKAKFGASDDLQIYHNGGNSIIADTGTGDLYVAGDNLRLTNAALSEIYARGYANGKFSLYYDNAEKLATTSTGINVTGSLDVTDVATTQTNLEVDPAGTAVALAIALG